MPMTQRLTQRFPLPTQRHPRLPVVQFNFQGSRLSLLRLLKLVYVHLVGLLDGKRNEKYDDCKLSESLVRSLYLQSSEGKRNKKEEEEKRWLGAAVQRKRDRIVRPYARPQVPGNFPTSSTRSAWCVLRSACTSASFLILSSSVESSVVACK